MSPLEILHQLSRRISQAKDLDEIYNLILDEIVAVMGVERASIMRFDPNSESLAIVAAKGMEEEIWKSIRISVGEGVSGKVWQEGQPVLIRNIKSESPRYKTHSYMIAPVTCFPMKVGVVPIGLINVTDKKNGEPFSDDDLRLLMLLSDQAASYMHIDDLACKVREGEKAKMEIELARDIQQKLLPKKSPKIPGLSVDGCLRTAGRVGADFYDWYPNGDGSFSFSVADVSGHNVGGALLAASLRSALRTHAGDRNGTAPVAEAANRMLFHDFFQSGQFASLFHARFDPKSRKLTYTNAGHPPAVLWRGPKGKIEFLQTLDSLLGIDENLRYHEKETILAHGDRLVIFSDGLTEAVCPDGKMFGTERLIGLLQEAPEKEASQIRDFILSALQEFTGKRPLKDDVTLVILY